MLRLLGFNQCFRIHDRLEAKLTRQREVAGLNANVEALPDPIFFDAVRGASGRNIAYQYR